jgi:DUF2914 family protein/tetratricopeptide repeat protein
MPDPVSLPSLFDGAEQAAIRGDYAEAARLLGEAARLQEATLGTNDVELANTLNNLAVAHERSGDLDAAEREYRRAHEIAAASRPADDPLVTTSAQNLREFCEANGRPLDRPAPARAPVATAEPLAPVAALEADVPTAIVPRREIPAAASAPPAPKTATLPSPVPAAAPAPAPAPAGAASSRAPAPVVREKTIAPGRRLPIPLLVALGALVLLAIWFFAGRRSSDAAAQPEAAAPDSVTPPAAASPAPVPAPIATPPPPPARSTAASAPAARSGTAGTVPITIGDVRLCRSLSASYECQPAGDTVPPGRLTFYTRLIVPQDTRVVHRWYRGDELRQAVRLDVAARKQGFRTFSRGTVHATDGEWRVELRTLDGRVLHTQTFRVR